MAFRSRRKPIDYEPAGYFVLRTPLLPIDEFLAWSEGLEAGETLDDPEQLQQKVDADITKLRLRLRSIVARPEILEALAVASPDLVEAVGLWERNPFTKRGLRVERSLVRYFSRMSSRPTPFGLFAGLSIGTVDAQTVLKLKRWQRCCRHARLDIRCVRQLAEMLASARPEMCK